MTDEKQEPKATLVEVMKALGCATSDLKGLSPDDRRDLRRWLDEEREASK